MTSRALLSGWRQVTRKSQNNGLESLGVESREKQGQPQCGHQASSEGPELLYTWTEAKPKRKEKARERAKLRCTRPGGPSQAVGETRPPWFKPTRCSGCGTWVSS